MGMTIPHDEQATADQEKGKWEMKELKPWHKQLCSLLAQGIDRQTIAQILDCTPEYVSMLAGQKKIKEYVAEMCGFAQLQLEAQFTSAVTAIGDTLANGNHKERMQAARLQMEATKRIGSGSGIPQEIVDTNSRLARLAERLLYLQGRQGPTGDIIEGEVIAHEHEEDAEAGQEGEDGAGQ
jgi:hypothetical protein